VSGGRGVRRDRALAIAAHVRREPATIDALEAEFGRRGYHPAEFILALSRALEDRLVTVEADRRVVAR